MPNNDWMMWINIHYHGNREGNAYDLSSGLKQEKSYQRCKSIDIDP